MKVNNVKLEWNVLFHDFNKDEIIPYNIFYGDFPVELSKYLKKQKTYKYEDIKEYMNKWALYNYWCKSEYEILVSGLHTKAKDFKIDVYTQIKMNIDRITEYVIKEMDIKYE